MHQKIMSVPFLHPYAYLTRSLWPGFCMVTRLPIQIIKHPLCAKDVCLLIVLPGNPNNPSMFSAYIMNLASVLWGKKWRTVTIWHLRNGPLRFSQIKILLPDCSVKVLSEVLKDLEEKHLIIRKQYHSIPVKVTYELHPETIPLITAQVIYHDALIKYFLKNAIRFDLPADVIEELKASN